MNPTNLSQLFASIFAGAAVLWLSSYSLSAYLAKGYHREHRPAPVAELPPELSALKQEAVADPGNAELQIRYARALVQASQAEPQSGLIMEAVQTLVALLEKEPMNEVALREVAEICLMSGLPDLAGKYYSRYLNIRPDDIKARVNYSLTLAEKGDYEVAKQNLDEVLEVDSNIFPARLALALVYKMSGEREQAKQNALLAKEIAPEEQAVLLVTSLLEELENPSKADIQQPASSQVADSSVSPARQIEAVFRGHPIVGPKVTSITWPNAKSCQIALENFPVAQMPEFAKQKFIAGVQAKLSNLPETLELQLVDAQTKQSLLQIVVGNSKEP